jgi:hypothetical protein
MDSNWLWIAAVNGALLLALFAVVIGIRRNANRKWQDQFAHFDDAVRAAELTNGAYFRSLESMLKSLEFVRACTEQAEQRLAGIVARPRAESDSRFETAALLLSAGEKPAKVAAMLNLPLNQVKRAREPQKTSPRGRKAAPKIVAEQTAPERKGRMGLWSARVKKLFPQSESELNDSSSHVENGPNGLNGTAVS